MVFLVTLNFLAPRVFLKLNPFDGIFDNGIGFNI